MVIPGTRWKRSSNRRKHFYANSSNNAFASFRSRVSKTGTVTGILQRQQRADRIKGAYVFINERGQPFTELYWTHDGTRWRGCALPFLKPNASPFWGVPIA